MPTMPLCTSLLHVTSLHRQHKLCKRLHDRADTPFLIHAGQSKQVHPVCSLHVLERLLNVMSFTPFIDLLVSLLCPQPHTSMDSSSSSTPADQATRTASGSLASTSQPGSSSSQQPRSAPARHSSEAAARPGNTVQSAAIADAGPARVRPPEASPWQALFALHEHSTAYRACLLRVLHGLDAPLICAAVRVLAVVVESKAASTDVLSSAGLLPVKQQRHQELMNALVGGESSDPDALFGTPHSSSSTAGKRQEGRGLAASQTAMGTSEPQTNGHQNPDLQNLRNSSSESLTPSSKDAAHNAPQQQDRSQQAQSQGTQQSGQGQQDAQASRQVVDALFAVLQQPLLPSTCLWQVGWLLSQLLAHAQSGASQLAPQHQKQLDQATQGSQAGLVGNLQGMWCDAVPALVHLEWQTGRQAIWQPPPASTAAAVQAWLQAILVQELGSSSRGGQGSQSAQAARRVLQAVHTFVALTQIQQVVHSGEISEQAPMAPVTDNMLRANEVREGALVALDQQVTCNVAFSRGEERRVFFAIHGLPQANKALQGAAAQAALARAAASTMASVVLADPGQQPNSGLVLSLAPLLGAAARVDTSHPKWLHVHVRPPVRGLLKLLKSSGSGSALLNVSRQLIDGHWVLSFPSPQQAQYAQEMVEEHSARLRTLYGEALLPMLTSPQTL
ncbi:hypothetical protein ABBQ38_001037 [Trebouxia sp. C0009 RCD-2024]